MKVNANITLNNKQKDFVNKYFKSFLQNNQMRQMREFFLDYVEQGGHEIDRSDEYAIQLWLMQNLNENLYFRGSDKVLSHEFELGGDNGLFSLKLPSHIKIIEEGAFEYSALEKIELNEGLEIIEENAFCDTCLTSIVIPSSVKRIDFWAFAKNSLLKSIKFTGNNKVILDSQLLYLSNADIYVPKNKTIKWINVHNAETEIARVESRMIHY